MDESAILLPTVIVVGVATALVFGAVMLRLACTICGVDDPRFSSAVGIVFLILAVTGGAGLLGCMLIGNLAATGCSPGNLALMQWVGVFLLLPVNMLLSAGVYRGLFLSSFSLGIRVWLTQAAILCCFSLILATVVVVGLALLEMGQEPVGEPRFPRLDG